MGIFLLSLFFIIITMVFIPFTISAETVPGRYQFIRVRLCIGKICILNLVFYVRIRHYVRIEIIQVKKHGFKVIYRLKRKKKQEKMKMRKIILPDDVRKLKLAMEIGLEDAAVTAMTTGVVGNALATALKIFGIEHASVRIQPNYDEISIKVWFSGILRLRFADIIFRFLKEKRRLYYASNRKRIKYHNV